MKKDRKTLSPPLLLLRNNDTYTESAYVIPVVHINFFGSFYLLATGGESCFPLSRASVLMLPNFYEENQRAERETSAFFIGSSSYIPCSTREGFFLRHKIHFTYSEKTSNNHYLCCFSIHCTPGFSSSSYYSPHCTIYYTATLYSSFTPNKMTMIHCMHQSSFVRV